MSGTAASAASTTVSVWDSVVGQTGAVTKLRAAATQPVHAYLFVGPPGSTKDEAARAFAVELLTGGDDPSSRDGRLVMAGEHPDVHEVVRVGAAISSPQAAEIVRQSWLAPVEGERKVMVLHEFHLLDATGAGKLLKSIEEPPASTHFIVLADFVPTDLVTISSRCVRIEFGAIAEADLAAQLIVEGVEAETAAVAAAGANGDLGDARLLAGDPEFGGRRDFFAAVPATLDGSGSAAVRLAVETLGHIETAATPLADRQRGELAELAERERQSGARGSGRAAIEARHKRELRRHRTDELRRGLGVIAGVYRQAVVDGKLGADPAMASIARLGDAAEALDHNPNEALLLQSTYWALTPLNR